MCPDSTLVHS